MHKIAITTTSFGKDDEKPLALLREAGYSAALNPFGRKMKENEVVDLCAGATGIIAGTEKLSREVLAQLTTVKVISRCGTGLDSVDLRAAAELGKKVYNTPDAPTIPVAELTVGMILDLLRRIGLMDRSIRAGKWDKRMGALLHGKRIGIIGFGRIGQKTGSLLAAFGAEISYADREEKTAHYPCTRKDIRDLLAWADIVTIHASGGSSAGPLLGREEIASMRKGGYLVNASRGGMIDESALYEAVSTGQLAGAALDVFDKEPYSGPLTGLENVVLTPHIGSYAREARIAMEIQSVENLLSGLKG